MSIKSKQNIYADIRPWVKIAVTQEDAKPSDPMWKAEPSKFENITAQQKRVRFLRKHGENNPEARALAVKLQACRPKRRCLSGACLQCGRLMQRWFLLISP